MTAPGVAAIDIEPAFAIRSKRRVVMSKLRRACVVALLVACACKPSTPGSKGTCGSAGEPCCNGTACNNGLICKGSICEPQSPSDAGKGGDALQPKLLGYLYALDALVYHPPNRVVSFSYFDDGSLVPLGQPVNLAGASDMKLAGSYLVIAGSGGVQSMAVDTTTGALNTVMSLPLSVSNDPLYYHLPLLSVHPTGAFVYVSVTNTAIEVLSLDANGVLTDQSRLAFGNAPPYAPAIHPSGSFGYVLTGPAPGSISVACPLACGCGGYDNQLSRVSIDATSGALSQDALLVTMKAPSGGLAMSPTGTAMWSWDFNGTINSYQIDAATRAITLTSTTNVPSAQWMAVSPSGASLQIASSCIRSTAMVSNGTVWPFRVNATTAALTNIGMPGSFTGAQAVAIDPDERFVFAGSSAGTISSWTLAPDGSYASAHAQVGAGQEIFALVAVKKTN
jgi:hypothetical protein